MHDVNYNKCYRSLRAYLDDQPNEGAIVLKPQDPLPESVIEDIKGTIF
jgi:hypothetical protein